MLPSRRALVLSTLVSTAIFEGITIAGRLLSGGSAAEWIERTEPPLWLQIHHMFWAIPVAAVAGAAWRRFPRLGRALAGVAFGLVASDLLHHFVVLPLWVGNTGWHWP
ncbi:hypothetical protein [Alienimonas californiensis]|uniref:Uncharacterized protein n=1 Tax=Alienimonas californiensis TaxID=2527989 RepID=A0A517PCG6_9PLAN|nr:hypothetical protein [Alienimonas californiensis]QDT17046.1 hypothetical protein CA12_31570 [Alienimonas californiensis]